MQMMKYATPILALLLAACGGDEGNTDAVVATPSTSSSIAQVLLNQYSSNEVNLNTVLATEPLYSESVQTSSNANGKQEASIERYDTISIQNKTFIEEQFRFNSISQQWMSLLANDSTTLYLMDGQWGHLGQAKVTSKGNDIILDYGNDIQYIISGTSRDISNVAVMDVNLSKNNNQTGPDYSLFKTPAPAFPAGSKAYYIGKSPLKTTYRSRYSNAVNFKSIDEWTAFYSINSKNTLDSSNLCPFQFDLTRKTVVFSNNPYASQKCTAKEQPYELRTIKQQQLLIMTPNQTENNSFIRKEFYAISNGNLLEGEVQEPFELANGTVSASGFFSLEVGFNKTAINHLLKHGGLPASAQLR
ncbi:hypothetical protein [Iodobacter fluviatilis]|uniref:Lipoprotein n=1 Tax=Iodobacter fluviatilis TaxID=537 RepID=A0A377Q7N3_9NEIS|nr:hypothetical protein [Iodobacter fluviatilis]TCU89390.1 hypothetical protein EV682_102302 [Iodobacter fluviatilis]STQ90760.1 Uncharacterised protein [Iodobacter fluviatilis]